MCETTEEQLTVQQDECIASATPLTRYRVCEWCGKEYKWRRKEQRFCSQSCANHASHPKGPPPVKVCEYCGKEYTTFDKKRRYCSTACSIAACSTYDHGIRHCEVCGKEYRPGHATQRFCSKSCARRGETRRISIHSPLEERFWKYVEKSDSGCWLWTGGLTDKGYGKIRQGRVGSPILIASRLSWELHFGPVPDGLFVCHSCDVNYPPGDTTYRRCVNPLHMFLGSNADNVHDMVAKGRNRCGERHYGAKLTNAAAHQIRVDYKEGIATVKELAERYGVSVDVVQNVINGKTYKHVA